MTRLIAVLLPALLVLAACSGGDLIPDPDAAVGGVSSDTISIGGDTFTIEGANFFEETDGSGLTVEVCGVEVPGRIVEPAARVITVPPGRSEEVSWGDTIRVEFDYPDAEPGVSDVTIVRPDGVEVVLEDAVECVGSEPEPEPEPNEPPEAAFEYTLDAEQPLLTVDFDASGSADPDGDDGALTFDWDFAGQASGETASPSNRFDLCTIVNDHDRELAAPFDVTLTVTDAEGATGTASATIDPQEQWGVTTLCDPLGDVFGGYYRFGSLAEYHDPDASVVPARTAPIGSEEDLYDVKRLSWFQGEETFNAEVETEHRMQLMPPEGPEGGGNVAPSSHDPDRYAERAPFGAMLMFMDGADAAGALTRQPELGEPYYVMEVYGGYTNEDGEINARMERAQQECTGDRSYATEVTLASGPASVTAYDGSENVVRLRGYLFEEGADAPTPVTLESGVEGTAMVGVSGEGMLPTDVVPNELDSGGPPEECPVAG